MDIYIHPMNRMKWSETHPLYFKSTSSALTMTPFKEVKLSMLGNVTTELAVTVQTHDYKEWELDQSELVRDFSSGATLEDYKAEPICYQIEEYRSIIRKIKYRYHHTSCVGLTIREGVSLFFNQDQIMRLVAHTKKEVA